MTRAILSLPGGAATRSSRCCASAWSIASTRSDASAASLLRRFSGAVARPDQERGRRPTFRTVTTSRAPSARTIAMELVKPSDSSTTHTSCGA
jgi:hypothetical protein